MINPKLVMLFPIRYYDTRQQLWISLCHASGIGKIYKPGEIVDPKHIQWHKKLYTMPDGTLVLKYGDLRDTALLIRKKNIQYNESFKALRSR